MADSVSGALFSQFRIQKRLKPQNYPVQNVALQRLGSERLHVGVAAMQGFRESMEDAHTVVLSLPEHPHRALVGVFDGHSGASVSDWLAQHLAPRLDAVADLADDAALVAACLAADAALLAAEPLAETHGSTAVFAVLEWDGADDVAVHVCNLGDSRLFVCDYAGSYTQVTYDHKPTQPDELARITKAGGFVARSRIDACLAVSRAFGDGSYKANAELPPHEQKVCAVPDVFHVRVAPSQFIFLCCDGVFEALSNDEAVALLHAALMRDGEHCDTAHVLGELARTVLRKGSKDNVTAMLVQLRNGSAYAAPDAFEAGEWYAGGNEAYVLAYKSSCERYGVTLEQAQAQWAQRSQPATPAVDSSDETTSSATSNDVSAPTSPITPARTTHPLSYYAGKYGGATARKAIIAATELVVTRGDKKR